MDYYYDVCDKAIKIKSKNGHLQSITHARLSECIRIKHIIENPHF